MFADRAALTFKPIEGVERYRVEIEDEWGNNIFSVETGSPNVVTSSGVLKPGANYYWQALAIREKLAPDSFLLASSLTNLGVVARLQGNLETAESCQKRSLAILEKLIPGSFHVAGLLSNLGGVAQDKGDLEAAEAYYQRSLAIREKLVPGSFDLAASLNNLAQIIALVLV